MPSDTSEPKDVGFSDLCAYEAGAEAMRAACLSAVSEELDIDGEGEDSWRRRRYKAAIEGAAP